MELQFFDDWQGLVHVLAMGSMAYAFLIALLRLTGKRTLSKMNAFDLVITVAMGSTFGTLLLDDSISLLEGALALTLLAGMQYVVAWSCVRSERFEHIIKSSPTIVIWQGRMLRDAIRNARLTEAEILAACRAQGVLSLDEVEALVLETSGEFSTLRVDGARSATTESSTLRTVLENTDG